MHYVTFETLLQFGIFVIALVGLVYKMTK